MKKQNKTATITFHNSYNCGSMLQTYALHKYLEYNGVYNEVIDFSNEGQKILYSVFAKNNSIKNIIKNIIVSFYKNKIKTNFDLYEEFKNKNFRLSEQKYSNINELNEKDYHTVITGSDQVWNITIEDGDDAYFLPWVKKARKVAYAPSFGAKNIKEYSDNPDKYAKYIKDFDALSIRENNGQKWIKELTGIDVDVLIDPTLLFDKEEYEKIANKKIEKELPNKYIFYYSPGYKKDINKLISNISKKYKLPVIAFNAKNFYVKGMNFRGFNLTSIEDPSVYLTLIKNAELVITTSFHGTIFSALFKKKFWTVKNGGMFGTDDRVMTLVKSLGLEDRLVKIEFDKNFNYLKNKSYKKFDEKLEVLRKKAKKFIDENIISKVNEDEERK